MRWASLVMLGLFGAFLLWVARYRYQVENVKLAKLNSVEAMVGSVGEDGDLHLVYDVGAQHYEVTRSVGVNFFPRIGAGDKVTLVYKPARPDAASLRHWSETYADSAVAGGFGVAGIGLAVGLFVMTGKTSVAAPRVVVTVATLDRPINLKTTRKAFATSLMVAGGVFVVAFLICRNPYFMWSPYLSYPAAVLVTLFGIFTIRQAFLNRSLRIYADQKGASMKDRLGRRHFLWEDVAGLKREIITRVVDDQTEEVLHYFILLDSAGRELMKLNEDEPMEPLEDWLRLRGYIPGRTGLTVSEEVRKSPLGRG